MTDIKERPILFSAPMVRAILEGRKTVTRRAVKVQPHDDATIEVDLYHPVVVDRRGMEQPGSEIFGAFSDDGMWGVKFPYGQPGDRLWVREAFGSQVRSYGGGTGRFTVYRATSPNAIDFKCASGKEYPVKWKPSIHMPRHLSRILLEITSVRVERLQEVTNEQARAEGCFFTDYGRKCGHGGKGWTEVGSCTAAESTHQQREGWMWDKTTSHEQCLGSARWAFANLWEKTGGDWEGNPWVWVIEFKKVMP